MNEQELGEGVGAFIATFGLLFFIFIAGMIVVAIVPFWIITKRLGWDPWWSLIMIVPLGSLIWPYYVAFSEWPIDKPRAGGGGPTVPPYPTSYPPQNPPYPPPA